MHPSNFSRTGRKRRNVQEAQLKVNKKDGGKKLKPNENTHNSLRRSSSGPELVANNLESQQRRASNPDISNAETNVPNITSICEFSGMPIGKLTSLEHSHRRNTVSLCEQHFEEVGQDIINGKIRHRSGSWSGVNESDDGQ